MCMYEGSMERLSDGCESGWWEGGERERGESGDIHNKQTRDGRSIRLVLLKDKSNCSNNVVLQKGGLEREKGEEARCERKRKMCVYEAEGSGSVWERCQGPRGGGGGRVEKLLEQFPRVFSSILHSA